MSQAFHQFVVAANPHSWLLTADNLHDQAVSLYGQRQRSTITLHRPHEPKSRTWDKTNRATFLLGAFALENAIKAFLVYENPQWISNGALSRLLRSHRLVDLHGKSKLIPYRTRYLWVLRSFEAGNESWARYPCGLTAAETDMEGVMSVKLWSAYLRLMRAYEEEACAPSGGDVDGATRVLGTLGDRGRLPRQLLIASQSKSRGSGPAGQQCRHARGKSLAHRLRQPASAKRAPQAVEATFVVTDEVELGLGRLPVLDLSPAACRWGLTGVKSGRHRPRAARR